MSKEIIGIINMRVPPNTELPKNIFLPPYMDVFSGGERYEDVFGIIRSTTCQSSLNELLENATALAKEFGAVRAEFHGFTPWLDMLVSEEIDLK